MQNKKSQVEDWIPLMLIIVVLLITWFLVGFTNKSSSATLAEYSRENILAKDSSQILIDYLRYSDNNGNIANNLAVYMQAKDSNDLQKIRQSTNDFFSKTVLETDYSTWSLEIIYGEEELIIEGSRANEQVLRKEVSKIYSPSLDKSPIELRLFFVTTRFVSG